MAFLVYMFVLLVAAGSIVFGLDLTQSPLQPPSYATASTTTASTANESPAPRAPARTAKTLPSVTVPSVVAPAAVKAASESAGAATARAQATSEEAGNQAPAATASVTAPNHCAIEACAAAYRSFRVSDCTYQPFGAERRLCTKTTGTKTVAATRPAVVHRASRNIDLRRVYDRRYAERDDYRDSYAAPPRGGAFDFFGFGR
jgi:hypothetical protein